MKVLIVHSGNSNTISPFIADQVESLRKLGVKFEFFGIQGKGVLGYLKNYNPLLKTIKKYKPDIIHAHYGLSGLLAVLQRAVPVVITFHGSDVNGKKERKLSFIASRLSTENIFVSKGLMKLMPSPNSHYIPCGVDLDVFHPRNKEDVTKELNLNVQKKHVLFSSSCEREVKNCPLAKKALEILDKSFDIELIELKNYTRKQVSLLLNAVDVALLTSYSEGSPQFIKEAMACNIPIVSTDVGDVREVIGKTEGCYITSFEPEDVADKIKKALAFRKRTTGREDIKHLKAELIANRIVDIYNKVVKK